MPIYKAQTAVILARPGLEVEHTVKFEANFANADPAVGIMTGYLDEMVVTEIDGLPEASFPKEVREAILAYLDEGRINDILAAQFQAETDAEIRAYEELGRGEPKTSWDHQ